MEEKAFLRKILEGIIDEGRARNWERIPSVTPFWAMHGKFFRDIYGSSGDGIQAAVESLAESAKNHAELGLNEEFQECEESLWCITEL